MNVDVNKIMNEPTKIPIVEIYEGELEMAAHQALDVLAKKSGLKYNNDECNSLYLQKIAEALITALKRQNSTTEISVVRKKYHPRG